MGPGNHVFKSQPSGFEYDQSQIPETVIGKMALERWMMDGSYVVFLPCSICLLCGQPLTSM